MPRTKTYEIGACKVFFKKTGGSEADLGYTSNGVTIRVTTETQEIEVDQEAVPLDEIVTKRTITVSTPLTNFSMSNMQLAFPGATLVTDGTDTTKQKLVIGSIAGDSLREYEGELRLHPVEKSASDKSKDFFFPCAAPVARDMEISYTKDGLRTLPLEFKAYPSEASGSVGNTIIFGDPSATAAAVESDPE